MPINELLAEYKNHLQDLGVYGILSEYTEKIRQIIITLNFLDTKRSAWIFPVAKHDIILNAFRNFGKNIAPLPANIVRIFGQKSKMDQKKILNPGLNDGTLQKNLSLDIEMECRIPKVLLQKLMPFQVEGVKFAIERNGRALIGDEMGLGMTLHFNVHILFDILFQLT